MTTAQTFSNGVQLGSPQPSGSYIQFPFTMTTQLDGPTGLVSFVLKFLVTPSALGTMKTLVIPNTVAVATLNTNTWFVFDPLPPALRPTSAGGLEMHFLVPTIVNGAENSNVRFTIDTTTNFMRFDLLAVSGIGLAAGPQYTAITYF